ncbi:MAG: polysaccharide biosynthesis/export family protein [Deltaproteobacteria bacterium]|nr:polysaccharide biosynthesis/export family protein [Deltaproteobacteria bacterium]
MLSYGVAVLTCIVLVFLFSPFSAAQDKSYRIGPEDVVTITIYAGGEEQHTSDVTVSAQGIMNAPFLGSVRAAGLTPSQLELQITKPLAKDYFVDPKVHVRIKEFHSINYYISGAIQSPGLYEMTSQASLLELIAKAGGVSFTAGNVAFIMRSAASHVMQGEPIDDVMSKSEPIKIDLRGLLERGDQSENPLLEAGDVIYIPPKQALRQSASKVYVEGEIRNPGLYDYQPGMTALSVCIMAGGFVKFSAPNRAKVIRKKGDEVEVIKINLYKVQEGKIADVELQAGDRVFIPESWL